MGNPNLIFENMKISTFFASILVVTICLNICLASKIKYDRRRSQHREGVEKLSQVKHSQNPGFSQVKSSQNPGFSQVGYSQHREGVEKLSQKQLYDLSQHREGVEKLSQGATLLAKSLAKSNSGSKSTYTDDPDFGGFWNCSRCQTQLKCSWSYGCKNFLHCAHYCQFEEDFDENQVCKLPPSILLKQCNQAITERDATPECLASKPASWTAPVNFTGTPVGKFNKWAKSD